MSRWHYSLCLKPDFETIYLVKIGTWPGLDEAPFHAVEKYFAYALTIRSEPVLLVSMLLLKRVDACPQCVQAGQEAEVAGHERHAWNAVRTKQQELIEIRPGKARSLGSVIGIETEYYMLQRPDGLRVP